MKVEGFVFSQLKNIDSSMKDTCDPASVLPWLWVIEALAGVKEVDRSTLMDLIDIAPIQPDNFGQNSREMIALRCLEGLVEYAGRINSNASSTLNSKVGFDYSQSCEDVLLRILQEIPLANLRMAAAELVKWDLHQFIVHKRATTIKCDLEKMKESILEGTHPYTDHIKECSGLALVNTGFPVSMSDGKHIALSRKGNAICIYAENMGTKEISTSPVQGNGNKSCEDDSENKKLLPSKRSRIDLDDENVMECLHENQIGKIDCEYFLRNKKKIKCHASSSFESTKGKPESQDGRVLLDNSSERVIVSEGEEHPRQNGPVETQGGGLVVEDSLEYQSQNEVCHNQSGVLDTNTVPLDTSEGILYQHLVESIPTIVALPDEIQHNDSDNKPRCENGIDFQSKDSDLAQQKAVGDKAEDVNGCEAQISSNSNGYRNEMADLAKEKYKLLLGQCSSGHDSIARTVFIGQNLDKNCDEGDQLLVSNKTTFPLVVSKSCLAPSATVMSHSKSGDEPLQITLSDKTNDDSEHHVEEIPTNVQSKYEIEFQLNKPNGQSANGTEPPVAGDEAVTGTDNGYRGEMSSSSDGCHNEEIDLTAKKHLLRTPSCDFSASCEWTEQHLCMKCNEGGQLLVCKMTTCPVVVHESCLHFKGSFDDEGNFLCPFCAYSRAVSEYLEAKKKASSARKKLAIFLSGGRQAKELVDVFHGKEVPSKKSSHEHLHIKNKGNGQLQLAENNTQSHASDHLNKADNNGFEKSKQQLEPSASCVNTISSCREIKNVNNWRLKECAGTKEGGMANPESSAIRGLSENQAPADYVDIADKFSSKKSNVVSTNQISKREGSQWRSPRKTKNDKIKEPACADDTGEKEISKGGTIPAYSLRYQKLKTQSKPPARITVRRKKIPWSSEEEEILREGVKKFANDAKKERKGIPWQEIFAFGCGVFHESRTAGDLKDKWRNMCGRRRHSSRK